MSDFPEIKNIRPMPIEFGVGFCSNEEIIGVEGLRHEQVKGYHNYHFTDDAWRWPVPTIFSSNYTIDAFSPNLNKQLHVGHLRNLAIACSLQRILNGSTFVALLGRSLGVQLEAEAELDRWLNFVSYSPHKYSDVLITAEAKIVGLPGQGEQAGCEVMGDPPVIVRRSDGRPTYAMHDIAFAKIIGPDYYITGGEQKEHFESLGLGKKHLLMGLVLDAVTGKKIKSRDGNALSAVEAMNMVKARLDKTPEPELLAWNILAWNFLHCSRNKDVKFNVEEWTKPDSQGLYIAYTFARVRAAIKAGLAAGTWQPAASGKLTDKDVRLVGFSSYFTHYRNRAVISFDPAPLAQYCHQLAQQLSSAYHAEKIADGRPELQFAISRANETLGTTMTLLGMFPMSEV